MKYALLLVQIVLISLVSFGGSHAQHVADEAMHYYDMLGRVDDVEADADLFRQQNDCGGITRTDDRWGNTGSGIEISDTLAGTSDMSNVFHGASSVSMWVRLSTNAAARRHSIFDARGNAAAAAPALSVDLSRGNIELRVCGRNSSAYDRSSHN